MAVPQQRAIFHRVVTKAQQASAMAEPLLPGRTASESLAQRTGLTTKQVRDQQRHQ